MKTEYIFFFKNILFIWGTLVYIFIYLFIVTAGFSKQNAIYFNLAIFGFILFISFFNQLFIGITLIITFMNVYFFQQLDVSLEL